MSWLCLFYAWISSPNGRGHFEAYQGEGLSQCQIAHIAAALHDLQNKYLHQLILPSNTMALKLSSAIKYFRIGFSIFTLNANKVTILFRSAAKPILAYFQHVNEATRYMDFKNEEHSDWQQLFVDLKSGFLSVWAIVKRYFVEAFLLQHLRETR